MNITYSYSDGLYGSDFSIHDLVGGGTISGSVDEFIQFGNTNLTGLVTAATGEYASDVGAAVDLNLVETPVGAPVAGTTLNLPGINVPVGSTGLSAGPFVLAGTLSIS